ncbi:MAG: 2'-5' RNA ligase family protein [Firmicutes bacterium]|nr:2'-5' RNA ligase family protein [Bacillota bacterium]
MKKRSIIIFPKLNNIEKIEDIRRKYDPLYNCIKPHITLVFPFESNIKTKEIKKHMKKVLSDIDKFKLKLKGITGSFDNYLFLNIKEGNDNIIKIHDKLYTGILKKHLYKKITYFPHLTVGKFEDLNSFQKAFMEVKNMDDVFEAVIEKIYVEIIDENENSNIECSISI